MKSKKRAPPTLEEILKRTAVVMYPAGPPASLTVQDRDSDGDTPLHKVSLWGDRSAISALAQAGADIDARGDMGKSPLCYAVMSNHVLAAERLLELGADPNLRDEFGLTPRQVALESGNKDMIKLFRATGTR